MRATAPFYLYAALLCTQGVACGPADDDPNSQNGELVCRGILAGDLVITEIMANPAGEDNGNEYFEIYNASSAAIDLSGLALASAKEDGSDEKVHIMGETIIEPGEYLALGGILPEFKPDYIRYGYADDLGTMRNESGLLALRCKDIEVDSVIYADAKDGRSLGLDGNLQPDHLINDITVNFCDATTEYAREAFGSPGSKNEPCSIVVQTTCDDGGTEREVIKPAAGDLVITEILPDPSASADEFGEWFEIMALADVDLNGLVAGKSADDPKLNLVSDSCMHVTAGTRILFARSADENLNGGLPTPDHTFTFGITNSGSTLFLGVGDEVIDLVSWTSTSAGKSIALDPGATDAALNDIDTNWCNGSTTYGAGDFGTPGAENLVCNTSGMCMDGDTFRATVAPAPGDVTITEVMANPSAVSDTAGEFIEIHFANAVDLNGLQLGTSVDPELDVKTTIDDVACISIPADSYVVFARNTDMALNGGLPADAQRFTFSLSQTSSTLYTTFVAHGGELLDLYEYMGSDTVAGASRQLDPDGDQFCTSTSPYGSGDLGTPGLANEQCP